MSRVRTAKDKAQMPVTQKRLRRTPYALSSMPKRDEHLYHVDMSMFNTDEFYVASNDDDENIPITKKRVLL